jgi:hypothetical protein
MNPILSAMSVRDEEFHEFESAFSACRLLV